MTYCVALKLKAGLVLLSDTRTNAGVDNIARFGKMFTWTVPGDRAMAIMTAGNLAVTQAVIAQIQEAIDDPNHQGDTLLNVPTMSRAAALLGGLMQGQQNQWGPGLTGMNESSAATMILAGQRAGAEPRLFMIYSAGNYIEATEDTPFFQLGEFKYGKPIIDRVITSDSSIEDGVTACLVSMDSTLRSNLSVGMPLDVAVIPNGALEFSVRRRIEADDKNFHAFSDAWSAALREAFTKMREAPKWS
ncbi:peptidase [Parvularcula marina]|uniref:Peptidase n=1 Tax=Parvularcula marina TaxID=2292771 RepID=A0A371R7J2_9PROT|nr:peptidase [Parvularcula marina]RFB01424.1 peptidase [Parvularcula marina]